VEVLEMDVCEESKERLYTFECARSLYAVNMDAIREVIHLDSLQSISPIYHAHPAVAGYTNIRGEIYQIITLGFLLEPDYRNVSSHDLILFKERVGPSFGMLIESSQEIVTVDSECVEAWHGNNPNDDVQALSNHIMKLQDKLIPIINPHCMLELV